MLSDQVRLQLRSHWLLDSQVIFLNHGAFGACPQPVLAAQQRLRLQIEREPLQFFMYGLEPQLDRARIALANFVGAPSQDLAFVPNATTGVNTVLRSRRFQVGDEILTTNHIYNACRNALDFVAERWGAQIVVASVPFPIESPEQVIEAVLSCCSARTQLALLDHVTSQTGLVFPIAQLVAALESQGIDTLIDGAHAPGMLPLNLQNLGATYYTGNCHKWLCAPKGAAFLYVRPDHQAEIRPLTISHGANSSRRDRARWLLEFDWVGTADPTPYLCIPTAIEWLRSLLPDGWPALMAHNHQLAIEARQILTQALNIAPLCPDSMLGTMAVLPLPDGTSEPLQAMLFEQFRIEVPIFPWPQPPYRWVRISAQIYNQTKEYQQLAQALQHIFS